LQRIVAPTGGVALVGCAATIATGAAATGVTVAGGAGGCGRTVRSPPCEAHTLTAAANVPSAHCATAFAGGAVTGAFAVGRTESGGGLTRAAGWTAAGVAGLVRRADAGAGAGGGGGLGGRSTAGLGTAAGGAGGGDDAGACAAAGEPNVRAASARPIAQPSGVAPTLRNGENGRAAGSERGLMVSP
jgi:hypothetical protein